MCAHRPITAAPGVGDLCGRDLELSELRSALAAAATGRGRLIALTGEPGIGKTRLAEATAELARAQGALVLWGPCWEGGGAPAYWPWIQVLRALDRAVDPGTFAAAHRPWLGRLAPELAGGATPADADLASEQARFALFDAVTGTLRAAAGDVPLVVVLDDVHVADRASALLLEFAARVLVDAGVVLLATWREAEASAREDLRPTLAGLARAGRILPLRGLDRGDLATFVALRGGGRAPADLVTAVHLATDGNPFYADEVLRLLAAEGRLDGAAPPDRIPLPDGVRDAIARRLSPLPADVRDGLAVASVVGREFRVETLAGAAGLEPADVVALLDRAITHGAVEEAADRLGRFRFRHALVMEVLYDGLSAVRRAALHRAVGETLERTYAAALDPHLAELAHHFVHAVPPGDPAKAIDYARRAGRRAMGALAYDEAVRHLEQAVRLLDLAEPDGALRAGLLLELGRAQTRSGATEAARASLIGCAEVARAAGLPRPFAEGVLELGAVGLPAGIVDEEMVALLEEALALLDPEPSPLRARTLARLAVALYWHPTSGTRRVVLAAEAERMARAVGDPHTLATVLGQVHLAIMGIASIEDEAVLREMDELVEQTGDRELEHLLKLWWVQCVMQRGQIAEARTRMRAYGQLARRLHQPRLLWYAHMYAAIEAGMDGRWEDAEAERQAAVQIGTQVPGSFAVSQTAASLFVDRWANDDLGVLAPAADALAAAYPLMGTWQSAAALAHARGGDVARARADLRGLARAPDVGLRARDVLWLVGLALLADAAASADVPELGRALVPLIEPEAAAGRHVFLASAAYVGPMTRFLGLARMAAGDHAGAVTALESAVATLEEHGIRGWLPATEKDLARARELAATATAPAGTAPAAPPALAVGPGTTAGTGLLRREGDIWTLALDGRTVRLRDSRGLALLAHLLARPGEDVHALELVGGGAPTAADDGLPVLDPTAVRAYRARAAELREELDEAERFHDPVRAERARDELEALARQLSGAVGLGGRTRTTGDDAERARVNATRAIRTTLRKVAEHDAGLGAELERTVRTGMVCRHVPGPVTWTVEA